MAKPKKKVKKKVSKKAKPPSLSNTIKAMKARKKMLDDL